MNRRFIASKHGLGELIMSFYFIILQFQPSPDISICYYLDLQLIIVAKVNVSLKYYFLIIFSLMLLGSKSKRLSTP